MKAFWTLAKAAWKNVAGRRLALCAYLLMSVIANLILLAEPYVIGKLLNNVQEIATSKDGIHQMTIYFVLMIAIPVGFWAFHGPSRVIEQRTAFYARISLFNHLFRIVTTLPVQWHKDHHSGETINKIRKSTGALNDFMTNSWNFVEMAIKLVGSIVALWLLLPFASIIAISVSVLALLIVFIFDKFLLKSYEALNEKDHFVASALHDYVTNIFTVITLRLEKLTQSELWDRLTNYLPLFRKNVMVNEWKWFMTTFMISVMTVVVLAWYALGTLNRGELLLAGTFFMLYDYLQKVGSAFYTFAWKYSATVQQYADLKAADSILKEERPAIQSLAPLPRTWKEIEIRNLRFSYATEDGHQEHMKGINVTLRKGDKIALVGSSGSGKSTLMGLIRGLMTADSATVFCDGVELKDGMHGIAEHVTLIPQEPELFANTIEYNISVDTKQPKQEIMEDAEIARFSSVLKRLPKGLKTNIAEKGVNLSGGEKQRLALARGIFAAKKSDIILLDEPTSSVDSQNELKIHKNLFERFKDRCVVSSIHRLHLLPLFSVVYVLERGKIVQQGDPKTLMEQPGQLRTLWEAYLKSEDKKAD